MPCLVSQIPSWLEASKSDAKLSFDEFSAVAVKALSSTCCAVLGFLPCCSYCLSVVLTATGCWLALYQGLADASNS